MLRMALESALPLISCVTTDTVNIKDILAYLKEEPVKEFDVNLFGRIGDDRSTRFLLSAKEASTFYVISPDDEDIDWDRVYAWLVKHDKTLVVVNPEEPCHSFFNAGSVKLPSGMLRDFLEDVVPGEDIEQLISVCGGLTLKDLGEIVRLACNEYEEVTPQALTKMRALYTSNTPGLQQINTDLEFYYPNQKLEDWLRVEGKLFLAEIPKRLIPRGLLFSGDAGVGKTLGAKRIANQLQLPLYRVDLGSLMSKWVGECHAEGTEFLTNNGIKQYHEITPQDLLGTFNLGNQRLEFQPWVSRTCEYYCGPIVSIDTNTLKAKVTPNHRVLMPSSACNKLGELQSIDSIPLNLTQRRCPVTTLGFEGVERNKFVLPEFVALTGRKYDSFEYSMDLFLEFLGYFISEGCTSKDQRGVIHLSRNPGIIADRMIATCRELSCKGNVTVLKSRNCLDIKFSNIALWHWLNVNCGLNSYEYSVPRNFLDVSFRQLNILMRALNDGDGSVDKKGRKGNFMYTTTSPALAEIVEEIALRLGFTPRTRIHHYNDGIRKPRFQVYASPRKHSTIYPKKHLQYSTYQGKVYCFTVPNGTLLTRYGGTWLVSGNSESALNHILTTIDNSEPSVVLLDEIEKLFQVGEDHGVTSRMLSQLLWWLQEHESKTLVLMTTNDKDTIPPELIRPGRIDHTIEFKGLKSKQVIDFTHKLLKSFESDYPELDPDVILNFIESGDKTWTPASLTNRIFSAIKIHISETI